MARLLSACAILLFATQIAAAQEPTPATTPETDALQGYYEEVVVKADLPRQEPTRRVSDPQFWIVGGLLGASMLADTKSTFDVFRRCDRCYESNPYVAPFVKRGPGVAFSAGVAFDVGVMAIAAKMKSSPHARFRRIWWVVPVALTVGHVVAYRHNQGVGH